MATQGCATQPEAPQRLDVPRGVPPDTPRIQGKTKNVTSTREILLRPLASTPNNHPGEEHGIGQQAPQLYTLTRKPPKRQACI